MRVQDLIVRQTRWKGRPAVFSTPWPPNSPKVMPMITVELQGWEDISEEWRFVNEEEGGAVGLENVGRARAQDVITPYFCKAELV